MFRISILVVFCVVSLSGAVYDEVYRPQLHYTPPKGWLWDPNGLVYGNGTYHLFYQHHPNKTTNVRDIHWGHAISTDLIHWKPLDTALYPPSDELVMFSGGGIFDYHNLTGLQTNTNVPTLILMPTAAEWTSREQNVWIAYSNDAPDYVKFQYYENNPIIPGPKNSEIVTAHRDAIIFKYEDYYVAIIAAYNRTKFYNSRDLLNWELVSEFGEHEGSHAGRWECPTLSSFNVTINGKQVEKYVMTISETDYAYPSQQYFVGSFDGKTFTNDNPEDTILWREHGPDNLAAVTFNDLPDGRRILLHWMGRGEYTQNINFTVWNGQMGIPRELNLVTVNDNQIRLASLPVREMESLRINPVHMQNITITNEFTYEIADSEKKKHLADIEMTLNLEKMNTDDAFDILFSGKKDQLKITFKNNEFTLDRSRAGKMIPIVNSSIEDGNFDNPFDGPSVPKVSFDDLFKVPRVSNSSTLKLRVIIDTDGIEMFADDGLNAMTAIFFSEDGIASKMSIQLHSHTYSSLLQLNELNVYEMKSIWQ